MYARLSIHRLSKLSAVALILGLQLSPTVALAALASYDLMGLPRAAPATMGALEASTGLSPPRGLSLTIERL